MDSAAIISHARPLLELLARGGPVVAILLFMSVIALTIAIAKMIQFSALGIARSEHAERSMNAWQGGHIRQAIELLNESSSHPVSRVMDVGMRGLVAGQNASLVREEVTRIGRDQLERLRSWLRPLEIMATLSPLLGLLGTVIGMIAAFRSLEAAGSQVDPAILSGGIWQALLTTAVGLIVAIPALLLHNWLERRVERCAHLVEDYATRVFTAAPRKSDAGGGRSSASGTNVTSARIADEPVSLGVRPTHGR